MKLDRNVNETGRGKYGLVNNRKLAEILRDGAEAHSTYINLTERPNSSVLINLMECMDLASGVDAAVKTLQKAGLIEWGEPGTEGEFFVIKLRDVYAKPALKAYATAAYNEARPVADMELAEYSHEVRQLANRAGYNSAFCKKPD